MRKNKKEILTLFFSVLLFCSCDLIEYHPYDGRIKGETGINAKNIARIESACEGKDTIRFVLIGDTQRNYNETQSFVKILNKRTDVDFVIHGGDLSDFGVTKEFMWMRDIMGKLNVPYVALLGNHDCLGNGEDIFSKIYGTPNFSFLAGSTKFICLNTNALEYDYSRPVPDFHFLKEELDEKRIGHDKTVFAMHVRPFSNQFNNNVAEVFQTFIKTFPKPQFCLNAHDHHVAIDDLFNDGLMYFGCANINKRSYMYFTILPDDTYNYEVVEY